MFYFNKCKIIINFFDLSITGSEMDITRIAEPLLLKNNVRDTTFGVILTFIKTFFITIFNLFDSIIEFMD
jgi:hypothetical protein